MKVEMEIRKDSMDAEVGPDLSVIDLKQRRSHVKSDGSVVLTHRTSGKSSFFRRPLEKAKVVLVDERRVPFMALYQVRINLAPTVSLFLR